MKNVRWIMFPYGMNKNPDGSWTFFNRAYKPLGVISTEWEEWDDPRHKLFLSKLGPATLAKLDWTGDGSGDKIYFYDDGTNPEKSKENMEEYLKKLAILIKIQEK